MLKNRTDESTGSSTALTTVGCEVVSLPDRHAAMQIWLRLL